MWAAAATRACDSEAKGLGSPLNQRWFMSTMSADAELQRKNERLELLLNLTTAIASSLDLREVLHAIAANIRFCFFPHPNTYGLDRRKSLANSSPPSVYWQ